MFTIFAYLIEKCIKFFVDDLLVFGSSLQSCLENLGNILCVETNQVLN